MSIVEEALRRSKALSQSAPDLTAPSEHVPVPVPVPDQTAARHPSRHVTTAALVFMLAVLCLVLSRIALPTILTADYAAPLSLPDLELAPTIPATGMAQPEFKLTGVMSGSGNAVAIINDEIVRVGDQIQSASITQITPTGVVLQRNAELLMLPLDE
jgi:hypothetical protein